MRNQQVDISAQCNNAHAISSDGSHKPADRHPRGLWSFLTWSFFLSQVIAADRLIGEATAAGNEEDAAAARRSRADSAAPSDKAAGSAPSGIAASAETIGLDDAVPAKAFAPSQIALSSDPAPRNGQSLPSKASSSDAAEVGGDAGDAGGGGGGDGGSGSTKPGCNDSDCSEYVCSPGECSPPIAGGPNSLGGSNSGGNGGSAGVDVGPGTIVIDGGVNARPIDVSVNAGKSVDVNIQPIDASIDAGPVGVSVNAGPVDASIDAGPVDVSVNAGPVDVDVTAASIDVSVNAALVGTTVTAELNLSDLLGFDVGLGSDGIFVGADIEVDLPLTIEQLGSNLVQTVESTIGIELNNLVNSDLSAVDALLGADEDLSHVTATLAEVTGLSFIGGPNPNGTPVTPSAPTDVLPNAVPVQIEVVVDLGDLGSNNQSLGSNNQSGDIASDGVIAIPARSSNDAGPIDDLFIGGQYTDYNMALQSLGNLDAISVSGTTNSESADPTVATSPVVEPAPDQNHSANLPPGPTAVELPVALEDSKLIGPSGISI